MAPYKIAVCKPDHLGDFILAIPALRSLERAGFDFTLYIASANFNLARYHFPQVDLVAVDLPYLRRDATQGAWSSAYKSLGSLRKFDLVLFLRRDAFMAPANFAQWSDTALFIEERDDCHQTHLEHAVVSQLTGGYNVEDVFFGGRDVKFPTRPQTVVFAIGAGFPHKKWSPLYWAELGQMLRARDMAVRILSGPGEVAESRIIAKASGIDAERDVIVGSNDFTAIRQWLNECDVVVAADGGSAHLCSLYKPVLSVFGPSPVARYAPIGMNNRVVTRALTCSPCVGFDLKIINACMSRECLYGLQSQQVLDALLMPSYLPGQTMILAGSDVHLAFGLSAQFEERSGYH